MLANRKYGRRFVATAAGLLAALGLLLALPLTTLGGTLPLKSLKKGVTTTTSHPVRSVTSTVTKATKSATGAAPSTSTGSSYTPPMHGSNPHGQGTVVSSSVSPSSHRPNSYNPGGSGGEALVVGRGRSWQGRNGKYHAHTTIVALLGIDYTLVQERATLVWLGNLADIELHPSLSRAQEPGTPTMVMFDLDPGPPADIVRCCEVANLLAELFDRLGLQAFAKTSGSKGMQVCVPLNTPTSYSVTKPFARRLAELLEQRLPDLVTARMTKSLRPGRVLVDWSQNDEHKTTVSAYSVRARERPTVSAPVTWEEVARCREEAEPELLTFTTDELLGRIATNGDLFAPVESLQQELPAIR